MNVTDGLAMRLESIVGVVTNESGLVTDWADQTANGHNASQNANANRRPRLLPRTLPSGAPAVRFDGEDDLLTLAGQVISSQDFSIFAVVNATPPDAGNKNLFGNWSSGAGNSQNSIFVGLTNYQAHNDTARVRFTDVHLEAGVLPHAMRHFILDCVTDNDPAGPGTSTVSFDGVLLFLGEDLDALGGRNLSSNPDTAPYTIGAQGDPDHGGSAGEFWAGDVGALLVYDRALSEAEQGEVRQYLRDTYLEPVPPAIEQLAPPADSIVSDLASVTVIFDEDVRNVDAGDLLFNGVALATNVVRINSRQYIFLLPQLETGEVIVSFARDNGITDEASEPNAFPGETWHYIVVEDAKPPVINSTIPAIGSLVSAFNFLTVVFDEDVTGVDTNDLLINGSATSTQVTVRSPSVYTFFFPEPPFGTVTVSFASDHGIIDLAPIPNPFAGFLAEYTLDPNAPPTLTIQRVTLPGGAGVRLTWPQSSTGGYTLEAATALPSSIWTAIPAAVVEGTEFVVTNAVSLSGNKFYRLSPP